MKHHQKTTQKCKLLVDKKNAKVEVKAPVDDDEKKYEMFISQEAKVNEAQKKQEAQKQKAIKKNELKEKKQEEKEKKEEE